VGQIVPILTLIKAKIGSNSLGQGRTTQPIKKPLNIKFKGFFRSRWITSERILVEVASIELKTQPINLKALLLNKKTH